MFIRKTGHTHYRGTSQHSGRGQYLALFSWNEYKAYDELTRACPDCWHARDTRQTAISEEYYPAYVWSELCPMHLDQRHRIEAPGTYSNGKPLLWATVRSCALSQMGHWMMGTIRIGGKSLTVSGPIGSDGLPMDLQDVPAKSRQDLIDVPEEIATVYWSDTGHNGIGSAGPTLLSWARATFK